MGEQTDRLAVKRGPTEKEIQNYGRLDKQTGIRTNRPKSGQKDREVEELTEEENQERKELQQQKKKENMDIQKNGQTQTKRRAEV